MNSRSGNQVTNIVVVGGRNSGKSTLCNILTNHEYTTPSFPSFHYQTFTYDNHRYGILEVPFVEEEGEKEAHAALIRKLDEIREVSLVVLCVPISQNLTPFLKSIVCYYMHMFEDLLKRFQLVVLSTLVSSDHINEWTEAQVEFDDISKSYAKAALRVFKENVESDPLLETPLHGLLGDIPEGCLADAEEAYSSYCDGKGSMNRYVLTIQTRNELMKVAHLSAPVSMDNRSHPLPPKMEADRKNKCAALLRDRKVVEESIKKYEKDNIDQLERIFRLQREAAAIDREISALKDRIESIPTKLSCMPKTFESRGFLHANNIESVLEGVPTEKFALVSIVYNCEVECGQYNDGRVGFVIKPGAITLTRSRASHNGSMVRGRSFAVVYAEWKGEDDPQVKKETETLMGKLNALETQRTNAIVGRGASIDSQNATAGVTERVEKQLKELLDSLGRLSPSRFRLDQLDALSKMLLEG